MATFKPPSAAASTPMHPSTQPSSHNGPPGTFAPGTKVQVGSHRVVVEKYLSEGGFAHVYVVHVPKADGKKDTAVLKRVAVPDKEALANMRTEVETMKKLKNHRHIVTYIDSHASQLKGGGYEVFLLMEYCSGGGLIDFMNTRLQHRLTEPEILKIFSDVAEGVACMHYLKPPLLHRDLKVENVLISKSGSSKMYKLCDFGSAAPPRPAATSAAEGRLIEDDVQRHTTLQYRSPEMIDVYRKRPINEKSDIWALGVLLYKLCYYTTPFEEQGQMAILTATFKYPAYPVFSDLTKKLIASMLTENPERRPNIYQVIREVAATRGTDVPIKDIYATRTHSEARRNEQLPSPQPNIKSPPTIGAVHSQPAQEKLVVPEVIPMRRGRPTASQQEFKPGSSPNRKQKGDPFAALDSTSLPIRAAAVDELAGRFPSLDDFSILHDKASDFHFDSAASPKNANSALSKRVTAALADEAFVQPHVAKSLPNSRAKTPPPDRRSIPLRKGPLLGPSEPRSELHLSKQKSAPNRSTIISIDTMTSHSVSSSDPPLPKVDQRPIWRVPSDIRKERPPPLTNLSPAQNFPVPEFRRSSATSRDGSPVRSPESSRPSLESPRSDALELTEPIYRSRSAHSRRPTNDLSRHSSDFAYDRSVSLRGSFLRRLSAGPKVREMSLDRDIAADDSNIASNVEFLRAMEEEDAARNNHRRNTSLSKQIKRTSGSLSGTKNILAGKFGEAFRRFETATSSAKPSRTSLTAEPLSADGLSPITASDVYSRDSDDERAVDEAEQLSPETRRELERRRLSQEEKRVADAAAAYRQRISGTNGNVQRGSGGSNRASMIQNRVKNLLDESTKTSPTKTAEGYGRFTDTISPDPVDVKQSKPVPPNATKKPHLNAQLQNPLAPPDISPNASNRNLEPYTNGAPTRPNAPPKPAALQRGASGTARVMQQPAEPSLSPESLDYWEADFGKRYPRISLEMVETEIGPSTGRTKTSREV